MAKRTLLMTIAIACVAALAALTARAGVQQCNTACQSRMTDCLLACDGRLSCELACKNQGAACVNACSSDAGPIERVESSDAGGETSREGGAGDARIGDAKTDRVSSEAAKDAAFRDR